MEEGTLFIIIIISCSSIGFISIGGGCRVSSKVYLLDADSVYYDCLVLLQ